MDDQPVVSVGDVSIARLHGRACWDCGAVSATLVPAGEATVHGHTQTWPIVRCAGGCASAPGDPS